MSSQVSLCQSRINFPCRNWIKSNFSMLKFELNYFESSHPSKVPHYLLVYERWKGWQSATFSDYKVTMGNSLSSSNPGGKRKRGRPRKIREKTPPEDFHHDLNFNSPCDLVDQEWSPARDNSPELKYFHESEEFKEEYNVHNINFFKRLFKGKSTV